MVVKGFIFTIMFRTSVKKTRS